MVTEVSEKNFEESIECALLFGGPDHCADSDGMLAEPTPSYGEPEPGGYRKRSHTDYDRALCLDPEMVISFVYATQPKEWEKLKAQHGEDAKDRFLTRVSSEISKRGTLDVLRKGIKDSGCKFSLAYFRPSSGLNQELETLYEANVFSIARQLHYSLKNENSIDLVLFLNGIPVFTSELKNPLNAQTVENAMKQYRLDRDPKEPFLRFGRCLAHFAVDPHLVYFTTELRGKHTIFFPFNQGKFGAAGNAPALRGFDTAYVWEKIWARDSVLNLIQHFIQEIEIEDDEGKKTGERALLFARFHQLDAVRRLVAHARNHGPGQRYLIQHSAGSGKSNSIAWLAHQLSVLHDDQDERVFDSIIVITDRRVLDRQLQRTVRQFEQTLGVVENIDTTSKQLKDALEEGKTIIVTTLQKFPVISKQVADLAGKRFAVIIDEAHSSQSGESVKGLKDVLAAASLEDAEDQDSQIEDLEDQILEDVKARGPQKHVSTFAFTATPKPKTLELFGTKRSDGKFEPFSLYSMRQAIEEKFILDVLENYITYKTYWNLLKTAADDPHYDKTKANYLLKSFVDLSAHAVGKKVEIAVEHFRTQVAHLIGGRAKAMFVTRSRLHAVRTKIALDKYLREKRYPYKALVAFSGRVIDAGIDVTESGMNGFPEKQTAQVFKQTEYRFLVVAEKFQTGFDQPLLHTMYVDKRLSGVNAVQTLSRLNRVLPPAKTETMVLDFANEADDIASAFKDFYEKTLLSEATDPNQLYDLQRRLLDHDIYTEGEVGAFAALFFTGAGQDQLYGALAPPISRFNELSHDEKVQFKGTLIDYVRLYAFLSQILTFADADLEKLYHFARLLRHELKTDGIVLPVEIQEKIDLATYALRETFQGKIEIERGKGELKPIQPKDDSALFVEQKEALSQIIQELNDRFGTEFSPEDAVFIDVLLERLGESETLNASVRANVPENSRLTFNHVVSDVLQEMVDTNFEFYKRVTDDVDFGKFFLDWLFDRYRESLKGSGSS